MDEKHLFWLETPTLLNLFEIIGALAFGVFLYLLRCRKQLWYGVIELVFSVIVLTITFIPQADLLAAKSALLGDYLLKGIGTATGLYILVRGMDNVRNGLPKPARVEWDRVFSGITILEHYDPPRLPRPPELPTGYRQGFITAITVLVTFSLAYLRFVVFEPQSGDWTPLGLAAACLDGVSSLILLLRFGAPFK